MTSSITDTLAFALRRRRRRGPMLLPPTWDLRHACWDPDGASPWWSERERNDG